jgi:hypothetical protein
MKFKLLKYVNNIFWGGGGSSAIVSVGVFYVWHKTTRLLPMWPREAKRLDTPALDGNPVPDLYPYMLSCGKIVLLDMIFLNAAKFTTRTPLSILISC